MAAHEEDHARLAAAARRAFAACVSTLQHGVSVHRFGESVSFATLGALLQSAERNVAQLLVGVADRQIVVSVNFAYTPRRTGGRDASARLGAAVAGKKRRRDPVEAQTDASLQRAAQRATAAGRPMGDAHVEALRAAAVAMQHALRGAQGEPALESWGAHASTNDAKPAVILSALFTPGVALPLSDLRRALGAACFDDGMLTVRDPAEMSAEYRLPLSDVARLVVAQGEPALALFATVKPPPPRPAPALSPAPPLPGQTQAPSGPPPIPISAARVAA